MPQQPRSFKISDLVRTSRSDVNLVLDLASHVGGKGSLFLMASDGTQYWDNVEHCHHIQDGLDLSSVAGLLRDRTIAHVVTVPMPEESVVKLLRSKRDLVDAPRPLQPLCAAPSHCGCAHLLQIQHEDASTADAALVRTLRRDIASARRKVAELGALLASAVGGSDDADDDVRREVCNRCGYPIPLDTDDPDSHAFCQWTEDRGCTPPPPVKVVDHG